MQRKGTRRGKSSAKAQQAQGGAQGEATFAWGVCYAQAQGVQVQVFKPSCSTQGVQVRPCITHSSGNTKGVPVPGKSPAAAAQGEAKVKNKKMQKNKNKNSVK
jgi:hypothetical protein